MSYFQRLRQWFANPDSTFAESDGLALSHDTVTPTRIGLAILVLGFGGFLLWAALAPLDEGVPAQGMVVVDTKRKTIQHQTGGIIEKVMVREGQQVNSGDLLIKLNDASATADFESARQRYLGMRVMEGRLIAEQTGKDVIDYSPDVLSGKDNPVVRQHMQTQDQLLISRRQSIKNELAAMAESIRAQQEAAKGFAAQLESRKQQYSLLLEEMNGLRDLVKEGYAPRNKLLELERTSAELASVLSDLQANLTRAKLSSSELTLRRLQREQEYRKEVDTQLADVRREVVADEERYKAAADALARTEIRAPVGGSIVGIANQTVGGVIAPGTRIMDVVPKDESLVLEAHVPPHLIDKLHVGQSADVRFSTFSQNPQLVVEGELISVSADLLTDTATNASYYLARIGLTPKGLKDLGNHQMQPGMPVEAVIKTGERSLLSYLLHPLIRRIAQGLKEE